MTIHVASAADERYVPALAAMLHSAATRTPEARFQVWVLHDGGIPAADRERLTAMLAGLAADLSFVEIPDARLAGLPTERFHKSCWYRILLPELVPELDRILFLDADMIVTDSLLPLWTTDISRHPFAAVANPRYPFLSNWPLNELGISDPRRYLNSGVLLMNLAWMRREGFVAMIRRYAEGHPGNCFPEQDALSALFHDRFLELHPRWNVQQTLYDLPLEKLPYSALEVAEAIGSPAVIHFLGPYKPWQYMCNHPMRHLYFEHLRQTPWPVRPLEGYRPIKRFLKPLPPVWHWRRWRWLAKWRAFVATLHGRSAPPSTVRR